MFNNGLVGFQPDNKCHGAFWATTPSISLQLAKLEEAKADVDTKIERLEQMEKRIEQRMSQLEKEGT